MRSREPLRADAADRIRLLQFITRFEIGGTERQSVNLMKGLDASRFRLSVACQERSGEYLDEVLALGVPVREYPIRSFTHPRTVRQVLGLARDIRRERIDVVHSYNFYGNVFALPAARLARTPVVVAAVRDIGADQTPRQKAVHRLVLGLAHRIVVNADAIRRWLVGQGIDAQKISVIPNGLDMTPFTRTTRKTSIRRELGLPEDARVVLLVARLDPVKGVDDFVDAAARIASRAPRTWFVIVGDDCASFGGSPAGEGWYREGLDARIRDLRLSGRVIFTGFRRDVPAFLAESAVSVLPSLSEGLSNTLLESMAAGVPTVATRVGGNPELVEHGVTGLLVPPRDPAALADAIGALLADRDLAERFGAAGRRRVRANFSLERMVERTQGLYGELLASVAGRAHTPAWTSRPERRSLSGSRDLRSVR